MMQSTGKTKSLYNVENLSRKNQMKKTVVEKRVNPDGVTQLIIDDEKHGRVLVSEGICPKSGVINFNFGFVAKLKHDDTFDYLENTKWNDTETLFSAVVNDYDDERPVFDWGSIIVKKYAQAIDV